jgi:hypothetical protein
VDADGRPEFAIICADRVEKFVAYDQDDMDDWIRCLSPKRKAGETGDRNEGMLYRFVFSRMYFLIKVLAFRGSRSWMDVEIRRKIWCLQAQALVCPSWRCDLLLQEQGTQSFLWFIDRFDQLLIQGDDFTIGSIPINSLCSVIPPDESESAAKGDWTFIVHSRRKSYQLTTKTQADANRWINAIQDVIDASPIIETPTEKLIDELKLVGPDEVSAIYAQHKVYSTISTSLLL